ncbi:MAG TPA: methyltransferase [Solirubrobacteraceae bacterium]|nr:methyltransferase [Solirubrobacteraceae bacterium]
MSGAAPGAAWQQPELVDTFLSERKQLLPMLDVQEALIERLFKRSDRPLRRFIDIGAGDGAMTRLLRGIERSAEAVLVDYSEPMLARAEQRLGAAGGAGWLAVRGDLRNPAWREALPAGPYDAAVSGYAIHHLPAARKRALFAEIRELLEPGAMFVNMDFVAIAGPLAGLFDEQMVANAIATEHAHHGARGDEQVERELLADGDDDQPDTIQEQLQWLADAGFVEPEVHFKWAEAAVFGGIRPLQ